MPMEHLKSLFDWTAVVLVGLTFICGAGALYTGNILNSRQSEQLRKFDLDLSKLRRENLLLQAAIQPRRLTDRQATELAGLSGFAGQTVEIKSYSGDTEGLILASQILDGLQKARLQILDNRLTVQPAGSISFGVSVKGTNNKLVAELARVLSQDGDLTATSSIASPRRPFSASVEFGVIRPAVPPAAIVTVGPKPLKTR